MALMDEVRGLGQRFGLTGGGFPRTPRMGTAALRAFGLAKIPTILWVAPSLEEATDQRCVIRVPLNRRTRNHLKVMYIGSMVVGADLAAGLMAMNCIGDTGERVDLLFKDMNANFLRRVESDALFTCDFGSQIAAAVQETISTGERVNLPVPVVVTTPDTSGDKPVTEFLMTLTLKYRQARSH